MTYAPFFRDTVDYVTESVSNRLSQVAPSLTEAERGVLSQATAQSVENILVWRLGRMLTLELHAAKLRGDLQAEEADERFNEFIEKATTSEYRVYLAQAYPALSSRQSVMVRNRIDAACELGLRLSSDRARLSRIADTSAGLSEVTWGIGDSHRRGRTVAHLRFGSTHRIVYKPRSLQSDSALRVLLDHLHRNDDVTIAVPEVMEAQGYGWAKYVTHRYCSGEAELHRFYTGMGAWLAVMLLLKGTDVHSDNVIAHGPVPFLVDCETLFTPDLERPASRLGRAHDIAAARVARTPISSGILPWRSHVPGDSGVAVDFSALGCLPGHQPVLQVQRLVRQGTDLARYEFEDAHLSPGQNLPVEHPDPWRFREDILSGFREFSGKISRLRDNGTLRSTMELFANCEMRLVTRATRTYSEIAHALWHPAALHDDLALKKRMIDLLCARKEADTRACASREGVAEEVNELSVGDIPYYTFLPASGEVVGPGMPVGTGKTHGNQIEKCLADWSELDMKFQEDIIATSLNSAYLDHYLPEFGDSDGSSHRGPSTDHETAAREKLMQTLVNLLCDAAIRGEDGTITWVGQNTTGNGMPVGPVPMNLYSGQYGIVVALCAYQYSVEAGITQEVEGLSDVIKGALRTLLFSRRSVAEDVKNLGAFTGIGGEIWSWLTLHTLTGSEDYLHLAEEAGRSAERQIRRRKPAGNDITAGLAGLIPPLIGLAERSGKGSFMLLAQEVATHLAKDSILSGHGVTWPCAAGSDYYGFAHGPGGIGWALARFDAAMQAHSWENISAAAFRTEASGPALAKHNGKRHHFSSWCAGPVGLALASVDLFKRTGGQHHLDRSRSIAASRTDDIQINNYTLCHGQLGAWELYNSLSLIDPTFEHQAEALLADATREVDRIAQQKCNTVSVGVMTGISGFLYQFLRSYRSLALPSVLTLQC